MDGKYDTTREMITYRFTRLPFGLTYSPFLLSATIRELADMYKTEFPTAAALVDNSTFMDDFTAGTENDECVTNLYYELVHLMNQILLVMAKWTTNSKHLKEIWRTDGVDFKEVTQNLGIDCDTVLDTLSLDHREVIGEYVEGQTTKRQVLYARLDSTTLWVRCPLCNSYFRTQSAEDYLGTNTCRMVLAHFGTLWLSNLPRLAQLRISRWVGTADKSHPQVHVFCDESERAYGAALYIRTCVVNENVVNLAFINNRLAPVKKVTLQN